MADEVQQTPQLESQVAEPQSEASEHSGADPVEPQASQDESGC